MSETMHRQFVGRFATRQTFIGVFSEKGTPVRWMISKMGRDNRLFVNLVRKGAETRQWLRCYVGEVFYREDGGMPEVDASVPKVCFEADSHEVTLTNAMLKALYEGRTDKMMIISSPEASMRPLNDEGNAPVDETQLPF